MQYNCPRQHHFFKIKNMTKKEEIKMWLEIFGTAYLDSDNIKWKIIDGKLIGKRSVWTFDFRTCWLEETEINNIKSWWCGKDSDYSEVF